MSSLVGYLSESSNECIVGVLGAAFIYYYLVEVVKEPTLICRPGPFKNFLENNIGLLRQKFWPTLWCFESRLQTVFASILRTTFLPDIKYRREVLLLSDGGEVALDWTDEGCSPKSPIVIILPGLTGASQAEYIKCLVNGAKTIGVRCVVFNNRGLGGLQLKTPRLYCAAKHGDLTEVIHHVKKSFPDSQLCATGISMGGLILGNYLAAKGKDSSLKAAMIISVPLNVFKGAENIEKPILNSLLGRHLAGSLCRTLQECEPLHEIKDQWDFEEVMKSRTVREFDSSFTAKHFGYKDVEDYYSDATLHNKLHKIKIPVLCLCAADDPFQPLDAIPVEEAKNSKHVALLITARGGHIGFMEGLWPRRAHDQYMARLFSQFYDSMFKETKLFEEIQNSN